MITTNLFESSAAKKLSAQKGIFSVVEYERDLSVEPEMAQIAYFASKMDVRKRQLIAQLQDDIGVISQKGRMQLMLGDIQAQTDVRNVGRLIKNIVGSSVTGETAIKPLYTGDGILVLEPSFRYVILEDLKEWQSGMVIEDGMFLACYDSVEIKVEARKTISSAALGGEGLFNTRLIGEGIVALESPVPRSELIEVTLDDDVIKIDGNMAIAWSSDLAFTVERTTPTLVGSVASGEGLVNTYRGSGKVLIAPVLKNKGIPSPSNKK
ncbi:MAG: AIM24 family protein [Lachnospiraceae bacterium]|nr:AIM24 family protein [Lachnospiraceae bacterium]